MTNNLKRQVEVQGTKKLDSVKGVRVLEFNELKQIEGGVAAPVVIGVAILYLAGTICGITQGKRFNGMP